MILDKRLLPPTVGTSLFKPVWKKPAGMLNDKVVTLHHIEHQILRRFNEPRIHFAIACASISRPDLRDEIYRPEDLDNQLNDQVQKFIKNKGKGSRVVNNELYLSKIFDWFEDDFEAGGVIGFLGRYEPGFKRFEAFDTIDYNWRLNKFTAKP